MCLITFSNHAQENVSSLEKSIFTVQTGLLGVWVNNEVRLSNTVALRSEIGLDSGFFIKQDNDAGFLMAPSLGLEPRWYYNINKRRTKGKKVSNNNSNFLTSSIKYIPDWFVISNYDDVNVTEQISIIPKWGMRRNFGQSNFNYEFGAGLGYRAIFYQFKTKNEAVIDLHVRVGYDF